MDDRPPIDIEANPDRASDSDSSDEAPRPPTLREIVLGELAQQVAVQPWRPHAQYHWFGEVGL